VPGYRVWVAVRCSHSSAMAVVARRVGRGSRRTINVPSGKPGASVAANHLLRCRTVRFRRLLGCPSV
jgi:hypothetical protein